MQVFDRGTLTVTLELVLAVCVIILVKVLLASVTVAVLWIRTMFVSFMEPIVSFFVLGLLDFLSVVVMVITSGDESNVDFDSVLFTVFLVLLLYTLIVAGVVGIIVLMMVTVFEGCVVAAETAVGT